MVAQGIVELLVIADRGEQRSSEYCGLPRGKLQLRSGGRVFAMHTVGS